MESNSFQVNEMEDTKVLLDESAHNDRHLNHLLYRNESKSHLSSKFVLILDKVCSNVTCRSSTHYYSSCRSSSSRISSILKRFLLLSLLFISLIILIVTLYAILLSYNDDSTRYHHRIDLSKQNITHKDFLVEFHALDQSNPSKYLIYDKPTKFIVSGKNCQLVNLDPWHNDTKKYCWSKETLNCTKYNDRALTYVKDNKLYFIEESSFANKTSDCCYKHLERKFNDETVVLDRICHPLDANNKDGIIIPLSHIVVNCSAANYTNVHSFINIELAEEDKLEKLAKEKIDDYYNVIFFGIDTMSRLNMYRQLPKSLKVLREEYPILEFRGYNKVGENTFPNLAPVLAGLTPDQLVSTKCWNTTYNNERGSDYFDNCQFLWNLFARYGYRTLFNEDWPNCSTFNYLKPGFLKQPTLHYGRPWHLGSKKYGHTDTSSGCVLCVRDRPSLDVYTNYLNDFITTYRNKPHFGFSWLNCPQHDDINGASRLDQYFADFFDKIKDKVNERTFMIVFSDHGYRWGSFLDTYIGHQEASLPFLSMSVPRLFQQRHPDLVKNLMDHRNKLITPFDLYHTMLDLLNLGRKRPSNANPLQYDETIEKSLPPKENNFTTISFFRPNEGTSKDRGCDEAGIPDNYCICNTFAETSANDTLVLASSWFLVRHINTKLEPEKLHCFELQLKSILAAKEYRLYSVKDGTPKVEYEIKIQTWPGDGIFEEVVRVYGNEDNCRPLIDKIAKADFMADTLEEDEKKELLDTCQFSIHSQSISRLNLYGKQSECLTHADAELKKMCYCKNFLTTNNSTSTKTTTTTTEPPQTTTI